jgi:hypothetical protein
MIKTPERAPVFVRERPLCIVHCRVFFNRLASETVLSILKLPRGGGFKNETAAFQRWRKQGLTTAKLIMPVGSSLSTLYDHLQFSDDSSFLRMIDKGSISAKNQAPP